MNLSILRDVIPAEYRKAIYAAFAFAAVFLGALDVLDIDALFGVTTDKLNELLLYLGAAVGFVATANTKPVQPEHFDVYDEPHDGQDLSGR